MIYGEEAKDSWRAKAENHRSLAAHLRRLLELDRPLDCGHEDRFGWEDRTVAGDVQERCAMCDCESMANENTVMRRKLREAPDAE